MESRSGADAEVPPGIHRAQATRRGAAGQDGSLRQRRRHARGHYLRSDGAGQCSQCARDQPVRCGGDRLHAYGDATAGRRRHQGPAARVVDADAIQCACGRQPVPAHLHLRRHSEGRGDWAGGHAGHEGAIHSHQRLQRQYLPSQGCAGARGRHLHRQRRWRGGPARFGVHRERSVQWRRLLPVGQQWRLGSGRPGPAREDGHPGVHQLQGRCRTRLRLGIPGSGRLSGRDVHNRGVIGAYPAQRRLRASSVGS